MESLYKQIEDVSMDVQTIRKSIFKILNKNHIKNSNNFNRMLQHNTIVISVSNDIYIQKEKYRLYIDKLQKMLESVHKSYEQIVEKIDSINKKYATAQGLYMDIEKSRNLEKYNSELQKINSVKKEIIDNINSIKEKQENLILSTDKILFDNSVMISKIINNTQMLKSFES